MIPMPKEIMGITTYDDNDNWVLKAGATKKQQEIYEKFKKDLESGKLSDTIIQYEE